MRIEDVTDADSIAAAAETASEATLLINNAGIYNTGGVLETPLETIRQEELEVHGVSVTALHVGFMETDMTTGIDAAKSDPAVVVADALDGVEAGRAEVLADDLTRSAKSQLSADR